MPDVPKVSSCYFDDEVEIDCCHMAMSEWSNYIYGSKLGLNRTGKQVQQNPQSPETTPYCR